MNRYLLFGFDQFYPGGGLSDFMGDFKSFVDIHEFIEIEENHRCHYQVLDIRDKIKFEYDGEGGFTDGSTK